MIASTFKTSIIWCLAYIFTFSIPVIACTCSDPYIPKCARFAEADEVIIGKIVNVRNGSRDMNRLLNKEGLAPDDEYQFKKIRLRVERQFKGLFRPFQEYFAETGHSCSLNLKVGERWVFFLNKDSTVKVPIIGSCQGSYRIRKDKKAPKSISDFGIDRNFGSFIFVSSESLGFLPRNFLRARLFDSEGLPVRESSNSDYLRVPKLKAGIYQIRIKYGFEATAYPLDNPIPFKSETIDGKTTFSDTVEVKRESCVYRRLSTSSW